MGRHRAAVYWWRRLVVLGLLVAVVVGVVVALTAREEPSAPSASSPAPPDPAASEPAPSEPATTEPQPCPADVLDVSVSTDAGEYGPGDVPRITLSVAVSGREPCVVDLVSAGAVELLVASGESRVWSSADCGGALPGGPVTLRPGDVEQQVVSWQRLRSEPGCPAALTDAPPGRYRLTGQVGDVTSEPVEFGLG